MRQDRLASILSQLAAGQLVRHTRLFRFLEGEAKLCDCVRKIRLLHRHWRMATNATGQFWHDLPERDLRGVMLRYFVQAIPVE